MRFYLFNSINNMLRASFDNQAAMRTYLRQHERHVAENSWYIEGEAKPIETAVLFNLDGKPFPRDQIGDVAGGLTPEEVPDAPNATQSIHAGKTTVDP